MEETTQAAIEEVSTNEEVLTYTKAELDALLQQEGDKRVTSARKKWDKETTERVSTAEKLARMTDADRKEFEFKQREEALIAKEREIILNANRVECMKIMSGKGLSTELVDFVLAEDAEEMNARIKLFEKVINEAVTAKVRERIGDTTPTAGATRGPITKESFRKLSLQEQTKIYQENPELFAQLIK